MCIYDRNNISKASKLDSFDKLKCFNDNSIQLHVKKVTNQNKIIHQLNELVLALVELSQHLQKIVCFLTYSPAFKNKFVHLMNLIT